MSVFKSIVMMLCYISLGTILLELAAPGSGHGAKLRPLIGLTSILMLFSVFSHGGFKLDLSLPDTMADGNGYEEADMTELILSEAEGEYEEYFTELLNKNEIAVSSVEVKLMLNEAEEAEIQSIHITLPEADDLEAARALIVNELPQMGDRLVLEVDKG